jgi:hypothetical protein
MAGPLHNPATWADLLAIPEEERFHEISVRAMGSTIQ